MKKHLLTNEEIEFLSHIFSNPLSRTKTLYQFGQKYLKALDGISLQEKTYALFQYILDNRENWKGEILIPLAYRPSGQTQINSISYPIREFIGWSIFYPKDVDNYFGFNDDGNIYIKETPSIRLVDKDKYKMVKKIIKDKEVSVKAKKDLNTSIKSRFSLSQKEDILNIVIACYIEVSTTKRKEINTDKNLYEEN
jgi:hypothetical protein